MKTLLLTVAFLVSTVLSFAQSATYEKRVPAGIKAIPKVVAETFKEQYPNAKVDSWYVTHLTYWQTDISSGWYRDWYGNVRRDVVVYTYEKPNYFEVEFMDGFGSLSRAIYNKYGYWYETCAIKRFANGLLEHLGRFQIQGLETLKTLRTNRNSRMARSYLSF